MNEERLSNEKLLNEREVIPLPSSLSTKEGEEKVLTGYAIVFNERSEKLGNFYEVIAPEALKDIDLSDIKCLVDHDYSKILGRTKSETLALAIDNRGLKFEVTLPNTSYANDLYESVKRGDISQCSFGFKVDSDDKRAQKITRLNNETYLRTINQVERLTEISIVTLPAYKETTAEIKRDYEQAINNYTKEKLAIELELLTI